MRDAFRQQIRRAKEAAQVQSRKRIYNTVRISWQGRGLNEAIPKRALARPEIEPLLALPPGELSMEQLVSLGDHFELTGVANVEPQLIASIVDAWDAYPLGRVVDDGASGKEIGKTAAMRFAFWAGYVAGPALAHRGRFQDAVDLVTRLTRRLAEPDYEGIDGGGGATDPDVRFLILAPALAGLTQYCPASLGRSAYERLSSYFQLMAGFAPHTECVQLRLACLGIAAGHAAVLPLLEVAGTIAVERYENRLADAFQLFRDHPESLGAGKSRQLVAA